MIVGVVVCPDLAETYWDEFRPDCDTARRDAVRHSVREQLVEKCMDMFEEIVGRGDEDCQDFFGEFGHRLALGVSQDPRSTRLAELLQRASQ